MRHIRSYHKIENILISKFPKQWHFRSFIDTSKNWLRLKCYHIFFFKPFCKSWKYAKCSRKTDWSGQFFEKNYPDTPTTLNFSAFETKNVIFGRNRNIISAWRCSYDFTKSKAQHSYRVCSCRNQSVFFLISDYIIHINICTYYSLFVKILTLLKI